MAVTIYRVQRHSPAHRAGIRAGEALLSINGNAIEDGLDYRFYAAERNPLLTVADTAGRTRECRVKKGEYDDLGLEFETFLIDEQRSCKNKCIFCFIDQMPQGLRPTLYFKDDDARMSFLFGNYITLTNLTDHDVERIIKMKISPVNISVHTTNPELRVKMMANPKAATSLTYLRRLADAGIAMNTQLVLCPGVNDGAELERTLSDMASLLPALQSISCVPVGITKYRQGLYPLQPYTPEQAGEVIDMVERYGKRFLQETGERVAYPADEFFLKAGRPLPGYDYYGDFNQLENGVGLCTLLREEFCEALDEMEGQAVPRLRRTVSLATGMAAYPLLSQLVWRAGERFSWLKCQVYAIRNDFFGENITVSGLVTGQDLIKQLSGKDLGEELLLPSSMLRHEGDLFLDDVSLKELGEQLGVPVRIVPNEGAALLGALLGAE